jgi:hypothetical protein
LVAASRNQVEKRRDVQSIRGKGAVSGSKPIRVELAAENSPSRIILRNIYTADETEFDGVDAVVAAVGQRSRTGLAESLREAGMPVRVIGDANLPQTVEAAVFQAARLARLA